LLPLTSIAASLHRNFLHEHTVEQNITKHCNACQAIPSS